MMHALPDTIDNTLVHSCHLGLDALGTALLINCPQVLRKVDYFA